MSGDENFDPYESWLGLPPGASHDHYALLGLPRFESDPALIEQRADERLRLVRGFQTGPRGRYTQKLLNELTAAKLCLLSPTARQSYDDLLRVLPQGAWTETEQEEGPAELPPGVGPVPSAMPLPPPVAPMGAAPPAEEEAGDGEGEGPDRRLLLAGVGLGVLAVCLGGWVIASLATAGKGDATAERPVATAIAAVVESPKPQPSPRVEASPGGDLDLIEIQQEGSGDFSLSPATAALTGNLVLELDGIDDVVQGWETVDDVARWQFRVVQPGFFQVQITYAAIDEVFGRQMNLTVDGQTKSFEVQPTSAAYRTDLLTIAVPKTGPHDLTLAPATRLDGDMKVKMIRLTPVGAGN